MKRTAKYITATLALVVALIAIRLFSNYSALDGTQGMIGGALLGEDTAYAPGYTESGFASILPGMTLQQVKDQIGNPINTWTNKDQSISMAWSKSPGSNNYRQRLLIFKDGIVSEKHHEFYFD